MQNITYEIPMATRGNIQYIYQKIPTAYGALYLAVGRLDPDTFILPQPALNPETLVLPAEVA